MHVIGWGANGGKATICGIIFKCFWVRILLRRNDVSVLQSLDWHQIAYPLTLPLMSLSMFPLCTKTGSGTQTCHKWWCPGKKAYSLASHATQVGGEPGAKFFKLKYYAMITGYSHAVLRNNREMLWLFAPFPPMVAS